jgi:alpha/beta superfamily hydrolase
MNKIVNDRIEIKFEGVSLEGCVLYPSSADNLPLKGIGFVVTHPMPMFGGNMKNNVCPFFLLLDLRQGCCRCDHLSL